MRSNKLNKGAIVIGWINQGKSADCGETMKNQLMIQRLEELGVNCRIIDIKGWRKHPWIFLKLAWYLLAHKKDTIIFSSSATNTYPMMKIMKRTGWKQNTVHWVIGGLFGERVKNGFFNKDIIKIVNHTLVESPQMKKQLDECGIPDVRVIPNFKPIEYLPSIEWKKESPCNRKFRFVYLSRIIPQKGCDYILEAARKLNDGYLKERFEIDFYGKIDDDYKDRFLNLINDLENVNYKGFLNLRKNEGYDILSSYDMMLFPTYWHGEGFAGIFIDAHICGLPIIASDWMHNKYFLKEGRTAVLIPVHDVKALTEKMQRCINGELDLYTMSLECQKSAHDYDVRSIITEELLKEIEVL